MKLSVMLLSTTTRLTLLDKLVTELTKQSKGLPVEILYLGDNKMMTVGGKRNRLKKLAIGQYSCWVDDDDWIHPTYISEILQRIPRNPDVICWTNKVTQGADAHPHPLVHRCRFSIKYTKDIKDIAKKTYYFKPCHLHPVKKAIANRAQFIEGSYCRSDHDWAAQIFPHLKTESVVNKELYIHRTDFIKEQKIRRSKEDFVRG